MSESLQVLFVGDPERRVDQDKVNVRLETLLRARARDFVEINPRDLNVYGLQRPNFRYTVTSKDHSRSEGLEVGRAESGGTGSDYARRRGDTSVFTMPCVVDAGSDRCVASSVRVIRRDPCSAVSTLMARSTDWITCPPLRRPCRSLIGKLSGTSCQQ